MEWEVSAVRYPMELIEVRNITIIKKKRVSVIHFQKKKLKKLQLYCRMCGCTIKGRCHYLTIIWKTSDNLRADCDL